MPDRRTRFAAYTLLIAMPPFSASAQNLSEAYSAALNHDPDHAAAQASRDAARENEALARALFRPKAQVQGTAGYSRITSDAEAVAGTGIAIPEKVEGASGSVLVQMQQPLIDGEAAAQRRQLRAGARASEAEFEGNRQHLALRVARAYFEVLRAESALTSLVAQEASARREQRAAQARFDAGRTKITDVREAQARADAAAAQIAVATAKRDIAAAGFTELTGLASHRLNGIRSDLQVSLPQRTLVEWQREAEVNAPVIAARRQQLAAVEAKADQYDWWSQTKVSAIGAYGQFWRGGNQAALLGVITTPERVSGFVAGVQLTMPLYTGGGLPAQRRQSEAEARSVAHQLDGAHRDVRLQVQQAWLEQRSSAEQISALRTALSSAQLQERAAVTGREVGVRTQSDVLAAQAQTFELARQLNDALANYELSRVALAAAAGTLTMEQLVQVDRDLVRRRTAS